MLTVLSNVMTTARKLTRRLRGESITVTTTTGTTTTIEDAVVKVEDATVGLPNEGPAAGQAVLRLDPSQRTLLLTCVTATVRGQVYDIVHVGDAYAGAFRVELRFDADRDTKLQSNMFDISGNQAVWHNP